MSLHENGQECLENGMGMMGGGMGPMMGMGSGMGVWMMLWSLIGLALIVLAVVGILWLVRNQGRNTTSQVSRPGAVEEVLRRRYAMGEIDEEEYRRRLSVLSEGNA